MRSMGTDDQHAPAARIRAARAYADLSQPGLAALVGVSAATIKRLERGYRATVIDDADLDRIADACGVPRAFMREGFQDGPLELTERQLARMTETIEAAIAQFRDGRDGGGATAAPVPRRRGN